ncbi:hypothetical protein FOPG_18745 [Fusarium oxysporum f. sp. conglutinans race 2 54008]|uniref:Cytochrome P450 n=1 Tax=Fusarium oxysporum f. sp. conglutinans race 2 54008 TaxID=1089457 RepID=X0GN05_FUSOX|nr:hypothetical protein FOPG_18745 [Fusarium oxysporum f. sp. conglutinans race 2 54008]
MVYSEAQQIANSASLGFLIVGALEVSLLYLLTRSIYLLYFHPYAKYPGPKIAALSDVWWAYHWLIGRYPWAIENAFKKYGDVVRIAPDEVAVFPYNAHQDMLLSGRKGTPTFIKTDIHPTFTPGERGVFAEINIDEHRKTKQALARAFSINAHKEQDSALHKIIDEFILKVEAHSHDTDDMDITMWFSLLAADLIGEMSVGHSFGNVKDGRPNHFIEKFFLTAPLTNLYTVIRRFPLIAPLVHLALPRKTVLQLHDILEELKVILKGRMAREKLEHEDYMSTLIRQDKPMYSEDYIFSQFTAIIIPLEAVASLMQSTVTCLGMYPDKLEKLQQEIRTSFASYDEIEPDALRDLPWLSAAVNESLRFHTIATFPQPRESPGGTLGDYYIPKGYRVQSSSFSLFRSERYFAKPREYHPERWLPATHPNYDHTFDNDDRAVFQPFSMGTRKCLGFVTADRQARTVLAKLVWKFDWVLTNSDEFDWERDLKVYQVTVRPKVKVRFTPTAH